MTASKARRPMRRPGPPPIQTDVVIVGQARPLMELVIYESAIVRRQNLNGHRVTSSLVDPAAVAQVLARVPSASGLLPRDTLGTGLVNGAPFFVQWIAPGIRRLQVQEHLYTIPIPPLLWCGCGDSYLIWALGSAEYPTRTDVPLFVPPFPNCYRNGTICWGNVQRPPAAKPGALAAVLKLFLEESAFNLHVAEGKSVAFPRSVLARWQALEASGDETYPLDDLMPAEYQLSWVLGGGPWKR